MGYFLEEIPTLPQNSIKPVLYLSFTAKENHIGPAVSEILSYRHTDRHPNNFIQGFFYLLLFGRVQGLNNLPNNKKVKLNLVIFFWYEKFNSIFQLR